MADNRGISWFVRLILDRESAQKVKREAQDALNSGTNPAGAQRNVRAIESSFERLTGTVKRLGGALTAYFSFDLARRWFSASFTAVDQMEAASRKLAGTARITGVALGFLQDTAAGLRRDFQLAEPIANDLTSAMAKLAQRTGDVTQAGPALTRFLDLAAVNGYGAEAALDALNLTLIGQDEGLNRLGLQNPQNIYVKWGAGADEASQAQAILNELMDAGSRAVGEYAKRNETAAGKQDLANQKLIEAQAAFGEAFGPTRIEALNVATLTWQNLAQAINDVAAAWHVVSNAASLGLPDDLTMAERQRYLSTGKLPTRTSTARASAPAAAGAPDPAAIALAAAAAGVRDDAERAAETARQRAMSNDWSTRAREAARLLQEQQDRIEAMHEAADRWIHSEAHAKLLGDGRTPFSLMPTGTQPKFERVETLGPLLGEEGPIEEMGRFETGFLRVLDNVENASAEAAYQMVSSFQDAFNLMREEGASISNFFEGVGRGMAGALLAGLAGFAQGKAKENIAAAIEAAAYALGFSAHGNFASAGAAWGAAAQHSAAAVAWGVLGGGAGAARGGVAGGRGAIPASTRDVGLGNAQNASGRGTEVHIHIDPLDPSRPAYQRNVYTAQQYAMERFGENARVTVHSGSGAGG